MDRTSNKVAKHDIMHKIRDLCRHKDFRNAYKYSRNLIKYSKYMELILIYGSLALYHNKSVIKYINTLTITECANLVNEGSAKNIAKLNLDKNCEIFLSIVLNVLVTRLLITHELPKSAKDRLSLFLKKWIDENVRSHDFEISLGKLIKLADKRASHNLFIIFSTLHAYKFESKYHLFPLKWSLLVRAMTNKLNRFEEKKIKTDLNENDMLTEEKKLSKLYIQLGGFCEYSGAVQFEFLLTAFSLYPTTNMYNVIKDRRNNLRNDWTEELFSGRTFEPNGIKPNLKDFYEQLGYDVITILMQPRNKLIQSNLDWSVLEKNLLQLLNKEYKLNLVRHYMFDSNRHLKYLHLDYSKFRHLSELNVYEEYLDSPFQDYQVVDNTNTIEVTNGSIYGFNRLLQMNDSRIENKLLPSVFVVPLTSSKTNRKNNFVYLKKPVRPILKETCAKRKVNQKKCSCC